MVDAYQETARTAEKSDIRAVVVRGRAAVRRRVTLGMRLRKRD